MLSASLLPPYRCVVALVNYHYLKAFLDPFKHIAIMMSIPSQLPSNVPAFKYKPLTENDAIRLVVLHPAEKTSARLECSIEHGTLSQYNQNLINQYIALSYVWGDATTKREIVVDGCLLNITANLHSALLHIRDAEEVIKIWADAICINQADTEERNQQVQQMGTVYSVARSTIIYLGQASQETDSLFAFLRSVCTGSQAPLSLRHEHFKGNHTSPEALAETIQTEILERAWFTRVWVFQELLLSRDPWVQCGTKRAKWADLYQLSKLAAPSRMNPNRTGHLEDMQKARRKFQYFIGGNDEGNSLLDLLSLRRDMGVSDPRDMIYAHLGIAADCLTKNLRLEVDYQKSYSDICTNIAVYFLEVYNDYRVLTYVDERPLGKRHENLPSWVPDWTSRKDHNMFDLPDVDIDQTGLPATISFQQSQNAKLQIKCEGTILARVQVIGNKTLEFRGLTRKDTCNAWSSGVDSAGDFKEFGKPTMRQHRYDRLVQNLQNIAGFTESQANLKELPDTEYTSWAFKFSSLLSSIGIGSGSDWQKLPIHPLVLLCTLPFDFFLPKDREGVSFEKVRKASIIHTLESSHGLLHGRRLCICGRDIGLSERNQSWRKDTRGPRFLALVPQSTQTGDLICRMYKDSRYMVLRAVAAGEPRIEGAIFEFVGMCYLDPSEERRPPLMRESYFLLQ